MSTLSKQSLRQPKKGARNAKILISAAALATTFGGWIAMANNTDSSSLFYHSPPPVVSSLQTDSQGLTPSGVDGMHVDSAPLPDRQPPTPLAMTRSSR